METDVDFIEIFRSRIFVMSMQNSLNETIMSLVPINTLYAATFSDMKFN
jgi:hypothetical protein